MAVDVLGVRERARIRLNEENRAKRALETLDILAAQHLPNRRLELQGLGSLLLIAIRNQHLIEPIRERKGLEGIEGY